MSRLLPIETKNPYFGLYLYPVAKEIMEEQQDKGWTAQEVPVENDISDYRQRLSIRQYNAVSVTLQSFVEIEQKVGEVWETIASWFPHSEIDGCATEISRMEKSVHAFFYQKMSDVLNIPPEDIAKNQQEIAVIKSKLEFLSRITSNLAADKPLTLATVAFIEQVLLFSNFGLLKSFKSNGNNYIGNTITGVDFVVRDETIHGEFATYLHNIYLAEYDKYIGPYDRVTHYFKIRDVMLEVVRHEDDIIDYIYGEDGEPINGISAEDLKQFIRSRANEVLIALGFEPYYEIGHNPIPSWFYKGNRSIKVHDFFAGNSSQYRRSWKFDSFSILPFIGDSDE